MRDTINVGISRMLWAMSRYSLNELFYKIRLRKEGASSSEAKRLAGLFLTWETLIDRVGQNVVGHHSLTFCRSALSSDLYAGNGWKLLQPRIVEGVGWMVWHLRRDLQGAAISYQKRQRTCNKTLKEQCTASKHMPAKVYYVTKGFF